MVFPKEYIEMSYVIVKMPRSCCIENCSNNAKSQTNLVFYIPSSDKQRRQRWLPPICRAQHHLTATFYTPRWSTICKGNIFLQFCYKIQSSMHQIFTQMYLTVSIRPSHMERTNGLSHGPPSLNTFLHRTLQSLFKRYTRFPQVLKNLLTTRYFSA